MKRVFVFCIGGTGLRVMKSITMLLAAGMDTKGYTIVPILIDPHMDLEEKRNLQTLQGEYQSVYDSIILSDGKPLNPIKGFFGTDIADLAKLNGLQNDISEPIAEKRSFGQPFNCLSFSFTAQVPTGAPTNTQPAALTAISLSSSTASTNGRTATTTRNAFASPSPSPASPSSLSNTPTPTSLPT